jgi:TonB family protein
MSGDIGGDGLMRPILSTLTLLGLLLGTSVQGLEAEKPKGEMGSEWVDRNGNSRRAQMGLQLEGERGARPDIYRPVMFDWPAGDLQKGRYPGNYAKDEEGEVSLRVAIGADGKVSACEIIQPAKIEAFNRHVCPHLISFARFLPALSDQGERISKSYDAIASYELIPRLVSAAPSSPSKPVPVRRAALITQPSLATAGIDEQTKRPSDVSYIAAAIGVNADGKAIACTLHSATNVDELDKHICDSLKKNLAFRPAINLETNKPIDDVVTVSMYWRN